MHSDDLPYIPPKEPYELSILMRNLVLLSCHMLKPHGWLVFFLQTVVDEYSDVDVETMVCKGMDMIMNSFQDFGSWGHQVSVIIFSSALCHVTPFFFLVE
jgi:tRNA (guanine10-N2)-methyltransferase